MKAGLVDKPRPDRHHRTPTPCLGGVAVFFSLLAGLLASSQLDLGFSGMSLETATPRAMFIFVAGTAFLLGLVDDLRRLSPPAKLAGQVVITAVFMAGAGPGPMASPSWDGALGLLWVVGLMNAFNFLDNMDGVLPGVSLVAALALAALFARDSMVVGPLLALSGSLLGFLFFNFPPARIFLGDAGSLLLGGGLAASAWLGASKAGSPPVWLALPLVMAYPIFDLSFVTLTRLSRGQPPYVGGRDHTTHRLATLLAGDTRAMWSVFGLAALSGVAGVMVARLPVVIGLSVFLALVLIYSGLGFRLARVPVCEESDRSS